VTFPRAVYPAPEEGKRDTEELGPKLSVLLIDDMEPVLRMLKDGLELNGHEVYAALSGKKALEIFKQRRIDVVVCDLGMPEMNGWEVGKAIGRFCEEEGVPRPPFVLITGWSGQQNDAKRIADSGVDAVVEKPLEIRKLISTIRKAIRNRQTPVGSPGTAG